MRFPAHDRDAFINVGYYFDKPPRFDDNMFYHHDTADSLVSYGVVYTTNKWRHLIFSSRRVVR